MIPTMAEVKARKIATICLACGQTEWDTKCEVKDGYHLHCQPPEVAAVISEKFRLAAAEEKNKKEAIFTALVEKAWAEGYRGYLSENHAALFLIHPDKGRIRICDWEVGRTSTYHGNIYGDAMSEDGPILGLVPKGPHPYELDVVQALANHVKARECRSGE